MAKKKPAPPAEPTDLVRKGLQLGALRNYDVLHQEKFEETAVKFLLQQFGLLAWKQELLTACQEQEGVRKLRLSYFNALFPGFPVLLLGKYIAGVARDTTVGSLFKNFSNLPGVRKYEEIWSEFGLLARQQRQGLALIFNWPFVPGGLVVHNNNIELDRTGTRMIRVLEREGQKPLRLVLEDLSSFCHMLKGHWTPAEG